MESQEDVSSIPNKGLPSIIGMEQIEFDVEGIRNLLQNLKSKEANGPYNKVALLGIQGRTLAWINAWLTERSERVVMGGVASSLVKLTSGVTQGTVLGPLWSSYVLVVYI